MKEKTGNTLQLVSARIVFGLFSFLLALYVFGAVTHSIFHHEAEHLDEQIFEFLSSVTGPGLIRWMKVLTFFGKPHFLIPAYIAIVCILLLKKQKNRALEVAIIAASSTLLSFSVKFIFQRERPDIQVLEYLGGYSFPSGHALLGFVFCSVVIYLVWQSHLTQGMKIVLALLLLVFSLAIGISRIVLRVHYPSDVIAGFALGYAWVLLSLWFQQKRMRATS